jgi:hypothetical protein
MAVLQPTVNQLPQAAQSALILPHHHLLRLHLRFTIMLGKMGWRYEKQSKFLIKMPKKTQKTDV